MKFGNVAKIDYLMSAERDWPQRLEGASYRYLLCSTARCGSNLVSDMLTQTGQAGAPMEYLNGRYIAGYLRSMKRDVSDPVNIKDYLSELERRRTTPNGYFGIKVHFEHLQSLYKEDLGRARSFLQSFDKIIMLRRRDKISQAVSLHKARVTQIWSSLDYQFLEPDDPRLKRKADFDPIAISRALADIIQQDFGWKNLLERLQLPFEEVWYEEVLRDYHGSSASLFAQLSIPLDKEKIVSPGISRQSRDDDKLVALFKEVLDVQDDDQAAGV